MPLGQCGVLRGLRCEKGVSGVSGGVTEEDQGSKRVVGEVLADGGNIFYHWDIELG
jgi:hypothetical protein